MERIEIVAKTLDEAIAIALEKFNTTRDNLIVRTVEEGSKGLFGLGARDAKIVASLREPVVQQPVVQQEPQAEEIQPQPAESVAPAPKRERISLDDRDTTQAEERATAFVRDVIEKMNLTCNVDCKKETDCIKLIVTGDDVGTVIGRRGETLDALQYLVNLHVNRGLHGDAYTRISLDTENYRAKREETLIRLANSMASKVVKYRKDMSLEPMNPYERRIIHSALQGRQNIKTRSVGEDPNRRVVISYKRS